MQFRSSIIWLPGLTFRVYVPTIKKNNKYYFKRYNNSYIMRNIAKFHVMASYRGYVPPFVA